MKVTLACLLVIVAATTAFNDAAVASCDPCVCGPGGSYPGNIEEWFRKYCPHRPRLQSSSAAELTKLTQIDRKRGGNGAFDTF